LEPRGPFRPRKRVVWAGETVVGFGIGQYLLRLLNIVGNGESAMDIYKHLPQFLRFIAHPAFRAF
jgi:hypothetical protein